MRSFCGQRSMCPPERRRQNSPGRRRYAMARPNLGTFLGLEAGRDVGLAESGLQPWEHDTPRNRPERASELESAPNLSRRGGITTRLDDKFSDHADTIPTPSAALSGRCSSAQVPRAEALGCSVFALRVRESACALIGISVSLSGCARIGAYAPSLDVYGSYFPAWLICLIAGIILTVLASQIGRVLGLSQLRKFGPLIPISLILIFSITTWFLFFAA
jgi:hypothetical protein